MHGPRWTILVTLLFVLTLDLLFPGVWAQMSSNSSGEVYEETILLKEYRFVPNVIAVNQRVLVRLKVVNDGGEEHNLFIERYEAQTKILRPGQFETIEFKANFEGNYMIICVVSEHVVRGMWGTLIVNPTVTAQTTRTGQQEVKITKEEATRPSVIPSPSGEPGRPRSEELPYNQAFLAVTLLIAIVSCALLITRLES